MRSHWQRQFVFLTLILSAVYPPARGQNVPEIESLANQTAGRVTRADPKTVLIGMRQGCILDSRLRENLDSSLRTLLRATVPGVQFSSRSDVDSFLKNNGFLSIDGYQDSVLRAVASSLGAEVLVIDNVIWKGPNYELSSKVIDVNTEKELATFTLTVPRSPADTEEKPIFFREIDSGPFLIILRGDSKRFPPFRYPACDKCPDPNYPAEARRRGLEGRISFLATVSEQGVAEQVALVKTIDPSLTASAMQAIQRWHFKSAIGLDGKPIAVRIPIEVTFALAH